MPRVTRYRTPNRTPLICSLIFAVALYVAFNAFRRQDPFSIITPAEHYRLIEMLLKLKASGQEHGELAERIRASIPMYEGETLVWPVHGKASYDCGRLPKRSF